MPEMTEMSEIAWAAGLFEGEGSVRYSQGGRILMLSMGMADKDVLDRFAAVVGGKIRGPYKGQGKNTPEHYKPIWHWQLTGLTEPAKVLRAFWSYLGERRRAKAADAIASYYLDDRPRFPKRRNLVAGAAKI